MYLLWLLLVAAILHNADGRCSSDTAGPTEYRTVGYKLQYRMSGDSEWQSMFIRSIGYSPAPPTFTTSEKPYGDYYTTNYKHLYSRDLDLIRNMGANSVRLWNWNFLGSAVHNHADFLDALWNNGTKPLRVLIPFDMGAYDATGKLIYSSLKDAQTRRSVLSDWSVLVDQYWRHPAILGWLIGNELDVAFSGQLDELFSLSNLMVQVAKEITNDRVQPITMPLSETNFLEIVKKYYPHSLLDMWSLQTYDRFTDTPSDYINATYDKQHPNKVLKPLLVTEFGHSSIQVTSDGNGHKTLTVNNTMQAEELIEFVVRLENFTNLVTGYSLMEWVDEWWKTAVDYQNPNCPNHRPELHTYCATYVKSGVGEDQFVIPIHEEWLGLFEQTLPEKSRSQTKYCIQPKEAYFALAEAWNGTAYHGEQCAVHRYPDPIQFLLGPMALVVACEILYLAWYRMTRKKPDHTHKIVGIRKRPSGSKLDLTTLEETVDEMDVADVEASDGVPRDAMAEFYDIRSRVASAFEPFTPSTCPNAETTEIYAFAIKRLTTAVWDHLTSFDPSAPEHTFEEVVDRCIRMVYIKQMEGYYIWAQGGDPKSGQGVVAPGVGHREPPTGDAMLSELALYEIVRQYAGTMNHCPEKTFQVYHFTHQYLGFFRGSSLDAMRRGMHILLMEVFRVIYCYLEQKVTLDDINADGQRAANNFPPVTLASGADNFTENDVAQVRAVLTSGNYNSLVTQVHQYGSVSEPGLSQFTQAFFNWSDPNYKQGKPENGGAGKSNPKKWAPEKEPLVPTPTNRLLYGSAGAADHPLAASSIQSPDEASTIVSMAQAFGLPELKRAFTQRGGFPTTFYNLGWVIRMILWVAVAAWYFQPSYPYTPVCLPQARAVLAILDCVLLFMLELCHWRMFFKRLIGFRHVVSACWRIATLMWVYCSFLDYLGLRKWLPELPSVALFPGASPIQMDAFLPYLLVEAFLAIYNEWKNFGRTHAYVLPGRLFKYSKKFFEGASLGGAATCGVAIIYLFSTDIPAEHGVPMLACSVLVGALVVGILFSSMFGQKENTMREARYLIHNWLFWGVIWTAVFFVFYEYIVPVVIKVRPDTLCVCPDEKIALTDELRKRCKFGSKLLCTTGVIMVWLSVIVINFVWVFACFQVMLLIYGIGRGKRDRVGNVKDWADVQKYFLQIKTTCFPSLSTALASKHNQMLVWNWFVRSLYTEYLLDAEEFAALKISFRPLEAEETVKWQLDEVEKGIKYSNPLFLRRPKNEEARRRVIYFLWSLQAIAARDRSEKAEVKPQFKAQFDWRRSNRVLAAPSLTVMTPCAAEPVIYSAEEIVNPHHQNRLHSNRSLRITPLEYLQCTYPDEWENFCAWLKAKLKENPHLANPSLLELSQYQLLRMFLDGDERMWSSEFIVLQIRLWASYRGQTLVRLIRGTMAWRHALELFATLENARLPKASQLADEQIEELIATKLQFIICHQVFGTANCKAQTNDMLTLFNNKKLGLYKFDLVYPDDRDRYKSLLRNWIDEKTHFVERCGPLRPNPPFPTEPKAENQQHGLPFTHGQVIGVLDMNQTTPMEDAFKLPFLLNKYFSPKSATLTLPFNSSELRADSVINPYRVVGFAEWQYTRGLSMVGEVAGQAEFCFTSIHQRVCRWPLRARLHYGHPDFMDGHWVRTRGGLSHASHLVNTAEDVFAGYEVVGRGERVEYVEWLQVQKGKESAIGPAFLFEKKLAQAAAQQMRSRDIYWQNQKASIFTKFGLFFGTYGFYVYNTLMAMSIHLYIIAIVFFTLSGVTNHDLGVNQSTLAVPWLFQVGFLFSFPLIVELSIEKGIMTGLIHFLKTLPFAVIYHVFQLQTKAAYFIEGLVRGKGGYIASQRGFGLDRLSFVDLYTTYASSHIEPGINLLAWVLIYATYSDMSWNEIFLRCLFMVIVVFCWVGAPILFNPYPSPEALAQDIAEMVQWLRNPLPQTRDIAFLLYEEHKRKDVTQARDNAAAKPDITTKTLRTWVESQRMSSWQAWYMNEVLLGPWGDEEMWFSGVGLVFQKAIMSFISYGPWLFWAYWASPSIEYSLWFAAPILLLLVFLGVLNNLLPHLQEYFNILKLYIPLLALVAAVFFTVQWKITAKEVIFYLLFYFVLYLVLTDLAISGWNFYAKFKSWFRRTTFSAKGISTRKRTQAHQDSIWFDRLAVPRFLIDIQKLYPLVALCLFTMLNSVLCLFSTTLTAMLYCPAVANAWERAAKSSRTAKGATLDVEKLVNTIQARTEEKLLSFVERTQSDAMARTTSDTE